MWMKANEIFISVFKLIPEMISIKSKCVVFLVFCSLFFWYKKKLFIMFLFVGIVKFNIFMFLSEIFLVSHLQIFYVIIIIEREDVYVKLR